MKLSLNSLLLFAVTLFLGVLDASAAAPTVIDPSATGVGLNAATLGGNVTADGGVAITQIGVVYSVTGVNNNPVNTDLNATVVPGVGTALGVFTVPVPGLSPGTAYSFKAYAINMDGTSYSAVGTFTTPTLPIISDTTVAAIELNGATLGGNLTGDGGGAIIARGVVFSQTALNNDPLLLGISVTDQVQGGTGLGVFTVPAGGLLPATSYSVKAYATSVHGTSYSPVKIFTTDTLVPILGIGTGAVTARNIQPLENQELRFTLDVPRIVDISTTGAPSLQGELFSEFDGSGGAITPTPAPGNIDFSKFLPAGNYVLRVAHTNSMGVQETFDLAITTSANVTTTTVTGIADTQAVLGGNVVDEGNLAITERGVVFSVLGTNADPLLNGAGVTPFPDASPVVGVFTVTPTTLTAATSYAFKAYATNSAGTQYSPVSIFTTDTTVPVLGIGTGTVPPRTIQPVESTATHSQEFLFTLLVARTVDISSTGAADIQGQVFQSGGTPVTPTPPAGNIAFNKFLPAGNYFLRVSHTDAMGSPEVFNLAIRTSAQVTTPTITDIVYTSSTAGGNVVDEGNLAVTERGVVFSVRSLNPDPIIGVPGVMGVTTAGTTGIFTGNLAMLSPATSYSLKAYATNGAGTQYSPILIFTTDTDFSPLMAPIGLSVINVTSRSITPGEIQEFKFTTDSPRNVDFSALGAANLDIGVYDGSNVLVPMTSGSGNAISFGVNLEAGEYTIRVEHTGMGAEEFFDLQVNPLELGLRPDLAVGSKLTALTGAEKYSPEIQRFDLTSKGKRLPAVNGLVTVLNRGSVADQMNVFGVKGSKEFKVLYKAGSTNVTSSIISGNYLTPFLVQGDAPVQISVKVTSNRKRLTSRDGRRTTVFRRTFVCYVRANSTKPNFAVFSDAVQLRVLTK